jgi:hypothetical protein
MIGEMNMVTKIMTCVVCAGLLVSAVSVRAADPPAAPAPLSPIAVVTNQMHSGDKGQMDAGVGQIREWIKGGRIGKDLWNIWLPALMRSQRYSDVAELSLGGALIKPTSDAIGPLMGLRARALIAMNQSPEGLAAAKSYYNVCDFKTTNDAVDVVGAAFAKSNPLEPAIANRFRDEQSRASAAAMSEADPGTRPSAQSQLPGTAKGEAAMLKSVVIDGKLYAGALESWSNRRTRIGDRVGYGNLLLVADKPLEAEAIFRELYKTAISPQDLSTAAEGLARCLRAEDGTLARANAWLTSLQRAGQPAALR